jgi:two-component system, response regulator YesN
MLLVDDEYLVRKGINETINWEEHGIKIIAEAANGEEGLEMALQYIPDIILTDIRMPFMDGLEFMSKLTATGLNFNIIVLSGYEEFSYVRTAIQNGAADYLLKPIDNAQLLDTVIKVGKKLKEERSTKLYFERLKDELSAIKKQFLRELIIGVYKNKDEILEKLKFLEIPIETFENYITSIRINEYNLVLQQLSKEELTKFKEQIIYSISQLLLLHSKFMGVVIEKDEEEWVIVIHMLNSNDDIIELIKSRCIELIDRIKKEFSQTISIGISDVCNNIEDINIAYKEAYTASFFKLLPGSSSVGYIKEKDVVGIRQEIRETLKYIRNNYSKEITIEMAAKELYISASYLMHIFKDEIGKTFNECLTEYRIEAAKGLLMDSKNKIYEVCEKVGYGDVKYFSQVFKKCTGMSPSEYMKNRL